MRAKLLAAHEQRPESDHGVTRDAKQRWKLGRPPEQRTQDRSDGDRPISSKAQSCGRRYFAIQRIGDDAHGGEGHAEFFGERSGLKRFHVHSYGAGIPMEPTLVPRIKHRFRNGRDGAQLSAGEALHKSARPLDIGFDRSIARHHSGCDDPIASRQMRIERAGDAKTDDCRRPGKHRFLDGVRLKSDISAAGEHAHPRCRSDPGFCFQTRDNNQTSPLTRRPANDWLNALRRIRAGRRQAVRALYESFAKMPIAPSLAAGPRTRVNGGFGIAREVIA